MALTGSALRRELAECVRLGRERRHTERVRALSAQHADQLEPEDSALFGRNWKENDHG